MPPSLALSIWFILLVLLLRWDPAKVSRTSWTLWVPVIWIFVVASRLPSQWMGGGTGTVEQALEEGNVVDRTIWLLLLVVAICILFSRSFQWGDFVAHNLALVAYVSFALLSIVWSDFAYVAFKRWFRDLGSYLMVLIVLSDEHPVEALRTVLRRLWYLLIPLSIVLIKYFNIGRVYDRWSGLAMYVGATTSKNSLGVLCMVSGIYFFWDTVTRWSDRRQSGTKQILWVNFAFGVMTLWLLHLAHSATSSVCFAIGCAVIVVARSNWGHRHRAILTAAIPMSFCLYLILGFGLGLNATFAEMVGRDPTLTDRTRIWSLLLNMNTNPLLGTGYESFWLGSRLDMVSQKAHEAINEAHNGYLEVYLNLGVIGLLLLIGFLMSGYRTICKRDVRANVTSLFLSVWTIVLFYNVTEASFKHGLTWLGLLVAAIDLPRREEEATSGIAIPIEENDVSEEINLWPGVPVGQEKAYDLTDLST